MTPLQRQCRAAASAADDGRATSRLSQRPVRRAGSGGAAALLRRAALGGRDARRAPVRARRRAAGDGGAGVVGTRARRLARGIRRAPPHRRPGGSWDGLGAGGAAGSLARRGGDGWAELATSRSDTNGRVTNLLPGDMKSAAGMYRLRFDTGAYFAALGVASFHPFVEIVFEIRDAEQYHVPLLVSPFGYTTYRGS